MDLGSLIPRLLGTRLGSRMHEGHGVIVIHSRGEILMEECFWCKVRRSGWTF